MDLFKKLKGEIKEMMGDDKKDKKDQQQQPISQGNYPDAPRDHTYNQPQPDYYNQPGQHGHQGPPQNYGPPQHGQSLPPGWVQQWDANSQRYYYIDPATGRSQWEPPVPQQQHFGGAPAPHGYGAPDSYTQGPSQQARGWADHGAAHPSMYPAEAQKKKSSGKGGLIAAGVGGAAVGALGAAALSGDSSDDEHHAPAPTGYYSSAPPPGQVPLEDNPNLSSSQRSSLEEAREDVEEAEAKVAGDSSASSSDVEELEEAREEYASEAESAEEELED